MAPKERNGKLVVKLIIAAIAAIVAIATILTVISAVNLKTTYDDMVEEELRLATVQLGSEMSNVWDGDWTYVDGVLYKGEENIMEEYQTILEEMKSSTGVEYSVFYGNERVLTTLSENGKLLTGFTVSDAVFNAVVGQGQEKYTPGAIPAGASTKYYSYYAPLANDDGTNVGMVYSGRETEDVDAKVRSSIILMIVLAIIFTVALSCLGYFIAIKSSVKMRAIADELGVLSQGNLKLNIDPTYIARNDEIGLLADGAQTLSNKLGEVIKTTMDMSAELKSAGAELADSANQASAASGQVSQAVDDISKGAVNQAESVETAAGNTQDIGHNIDEVADNVQQLNGYAEHMKTSCEAAMSALNSLIAQSSEVQASVKDIGNTIDSTNESAKEISKFSEAITEIASQTNLLSLNASIEAARAGEAGKGFAVVATEIGQLAVQSSNSAEEIKKIVEKLVEDSEASVAVMQRLNDDFTQQEHHLDDTKNNMQDMADNVGNVADSADNIAQHVEELNSAKDQLTEIISDLSAISEENAASSEETNASMQELNATFAIISESASKLQGLASDMTDAISYFKP
ncbi:methyl-accepting chemotaxis protein [Butyrivibrio proteoclasticus]|uniref:methyl-accepting chemotaxis protein n=1 Tax=Butyrivibrio proteoclasticus TaxID=43305 RepID=UPI00047EAA3C|nr:methyl-accepting chemotaxis protein [Butyrivibrio proteoclasticus]